MSHSATEFVTLMVTFSVFLSFQTPVLSNPRTLSFVVERKIFSVEFANLKLNVSQGLWFEELINSPAEWSMPLRLPHGSMAPSN